MVYLSLINGKFAQRVNADIVGAKQRELKSGRIVYEKSYAHAAGIVTNLELRSNEYEGKVFKSMCITLDDEIQIQLSGSMDNHQNKDIVNTLLSPDCDITSKLVFIPTKAEKGYSQVLILQNNKGIRRFSNKANPNDVPQPEEVDKMGARVWDWTKQDEWYYAKFQILAQEVQKNEPNRELTNSIPMQQEVAPQQEVKPDSDGMEEFPDRIQEEEPTKEDLKNGGEKDVNPSDIPF